MDLSPATDGHRFRVDELDLPQRHGSLRSIACDLVAVHRAGLGVSFLMAVLERETTEKELDLVVLRCDRCRNNSER